MFLKNLTIKGFKSFADTADMGLEPGVTVVVGPNGSGKSNVVDAIAWVLGAQAPSAVRSQKMDDVIFAGTSNRPALGRAEVSLTIDNSAGLLPIDFSEVTISRTLFRTGESEYSVNGVSCRLLDIQELLSDSGVGRMQHVIISQGQIDAVLNAKPTDRRLIIEEAAGVLKFRKRKEKAERRLAATEANLTRVQDLLREVRRGLRPLERQAEAARRHGALVDELGALRIFVAGKELAGLRSRLDTARRDLTTHHDTQDAARRRLAELDAAVLAAEAELNATGASDVGDELTRFEALRERARGLAAVLTERERSLARERESTVDAALIASLEADRAGLEAELAEIERLEADLGPDVAEVARAEDGLAGARATFEQRWGEGLTAPSGEAAAARAELDAARRAVERARAELARMDAATDAMSERLGRLETELADVVGRRDAATEALPDQLEVATQAEAEAEAAQRALDAAIATVSEAEADLRSWQARADALFMALEAARTDAGAEHLAAVEGVIGTLLDLVEVDDGWEAAFEVAAAEALGAVVVSDPGAARAALDALSAGTGTGAVLPLGVARRTIAGPGVGELIRDHVRAARPGVDELLDAVLGGAVRVRGSWQAGLDLALAHPEVVIVTDDGARFGPGSWRVGGSATGATGAALDEAIGRVEAASAHVESVTVAREVTRERARSLRDTATEARQTADAGERNAQRATDRVAALNEQVTQLRADLAGGGGERAELEDRITAEQRRIAELEAAVPAMEAEERAAAESLEAMDEARRALDERARATASMRSELEVRAAQLTQRRSTVRTRLDEVDQRLSRNEAKAAEAAARRAELDDRATALAALSRSCQDRMAVVDERVTHLREQRRAQTEAQRAVGARLDGLRRDRLTTERTLAETQERAQRSELDLQEINLRIEAATETLRRDLDTDPATAMAAECPELPEGAAPAARVRELERELRIMGPINPLALEEYEALQERHTFLQTQLDDVKAGRRELSKVIKAIDVEIVNVFAAAFADVSQNFTELFSTLFPGGTGNIQLTDPDDLLETGIEVEAKPSGKNVRKLSLLSGGERSLTALAFLFAVFRSRPSPFYVMDEVEAALDDVNLHRFLDLVAEFREEAQLVIVSHQKRTMEAADILYGVTMAPGGSSKVVSERGAAAPAGAA